MRLQGRGESIQGRCTCPAYEDAGFCKHLVATGLVANSALIEESLPADALALIAGHIAMLDKAQLVRLLLELARSDWRVLRSLGFELGVDLDFDPDQRRAGQAASARHARAKAPGAEPVRRRKAVLKALADS